MKSVVAAFGAVLIALSTQAASAADPLKLSLGADDKYTTQAQKDADDLHLDQAHAEMIEAFTIKQGDKVVAAIISGTAMVPNSAKVANRTCFTAVVEPDTTQAPSGKSIARGVGQGDWEPEACGQLFGIALLPDQSTDNEVRVGTLFTATVKDSKTLEPVIMVWNRQEHSLLIDKALTAKAAKAGPKNLADLKAALKAS